MTDEELIKEIEQLPLERQKQILEVISRHVIDDRWMPESTGATILKAPDPFPHNTSAISDENGHGSLAQSLYGILQFETGAPTDAEIKDLIADYLVKKYY